MDEEMTLLFSWGGPCRDLMVCLLIIPTAIDWFVSNLGIWGGGWIWCKAAGFLDFFLAAEYPFLLARKKR